MSQTVQYSVSCHDIVGHLFRVTCRVTVPDPEGQCFRMPAWVPGSYLIRDFAGRVLQVSATDHAGHFLPERMDKSCWRCRPGSGPVDFELIIHALDDSVRAAWLDSDYAFLNGAALFPEAMNQTGPVELSVNNPGQDGWQLATSMPALEVDGKGFGRYRCSSYRELIDHPMLAGRLHCEQFDVLGCPHRLWVQGETGSGVDWRGLVGDMQRICAEHQRMFGSEPPFERYDFLLRVREDGYGGLEHRSSTALVCSRADLPRTGQAQDAGNRRLLGLISHEYFHLWNVKRIQPAAVARSALDTEAHFRDLWVYEGITSYYDNLALVRAGVVRVNRYLGMLADELNRLQQSPGRRWQTLGESSYEAWIKLYRPGPDATNTGISYYNKGALVALMLDLWLTAESDGASSLDQVMQEMARRYALDGVAAPEHALVDVATEVSRLDVAEFLAPWIDGHRELVEEGALPQLLLRFGIRCQALPPRSDGDRLLAITGLKLGEAPGRDAPLPVTHVEAGSAAQQAGLNPGDQLLCWNGIRLRTADLGRHLAGVRKTPGVRLHYFRDSVLREALLDCNEPEAAVWSCRLIDDASPDQLSLRQRWLRVSGRSEPESTESEAAIDD